MMATILHIAGHGVKRDGSFDPGASGYVTQGEWRYYAYSFFDLLKKYQVEGHKVVYHTDYNVYDYGNIVNLAKGYGDDTIVIEWHFDATGTPEASGGHVIVHSSYNPDELDLRLRDGINKLLGVRYTHKGHRGISGRSDLANVNRTAKGGVNYRLIELGFGTSPRDSKIMLNQMDQLAKDMSEAIFNTKISSEIKKPVSMAGYHVVKSGDTLWGIGRDYGVTVDELKNLNNLESNLIFPGQSLKVEGGDTPLPKPKPQPEDDPEATPNVSITKGTWVRVPSNKLYATGNSTSPVISRELSAQVDAINPNWKNTVRLIKNGVYQGFARISDITGGTQSVVQKKTAEQVAQDIANGRGGWGNNPERARKLMSAGYDPEFIQDRVNQILGYKSVKELADEVERGLHGNGEQRKKSLGSRYDEVQAEINRRYK